MNGMDFVASVSAGIRQVPKGERNSAARAATKVLRDYIEKDPLKVMAGTIGGCAAKQGAKQGASRVLSTVLSTMLSSSNEPEANSATCESSGPEVSQDLGGLGGNMPSKIPSRTQADTEAESKQHQSIIEASGSGSRSTSKRLDARETVAQTVALVEQRYRSYGHLLRPSARSLHRRHIAARLAEGWSAAELAAAVDGNHLDEWHARVGKHDLAYVLRSSEQVARFVDLARQGGHRDMAQEAQSDALARRYSDQGSGQEEIQTSLPGAAIASDGDDK